MFSRPLDLTGARGLVTRLAGFDRVFRLPGQESPACHRGGHVHVSHQGTFFVAIAVLSLAAAVTAAGRGGSTTPSQGPRRTPAAPVFNEGEYRAALVQLPYGYVGAALINSGDPLEPSCFRSRYRLPRPRATAILAMVAGDADTAANVRATNTTRR
jgi:hypothetical protein